MPEELYAKLDELYARLNEPEPEDLKKNDIWDNPEFVTEEEFLNWINGLDN